MDEQLKVRIVADNTDAKNKIEETKKGINSLSSTQTVKIDLEGLGLSELEDLRSTFVEDNWSSSAIEQIDRAIAEFKQVQDSTASSVPKVATPINNSANGISKKDLEKLAKAMFGVKELAEIIQKVAAQNEKLQAALNNLWSALGTALEPVFNFIAKFINTIAVLLGKIFGTTKKTAQSSAATAKSLAGFDEINNLSTSSGGAGSSAADPGHWGLDEFIEKCKLLAVVIGVVSLAIAGIATLLSGVTFAGGVAIAALVALVILNINNIKNMIEGAIDVYVGVIQAGVRSIGLIVTIPFALITGAIKGVWDGAKALFKNLKDGKSWSEAWQACKQAAKEGFDAVWNYCDEKFISPIKNSVKDIYNNSIRTGLQKICDGMKGIVNSFIGMVNSVIGIVNKIPGVSLSKMNTWGGWTVPKLASGGQVDNGQLFIANESGPELVGSMNGKSTVANNDQIIEGIKQGVIEALSQSNNNQTINLSIDGKVLSTAVLKNIKQQQRVMGVSLI